MLKLLPTKGFCHSRFFFVIPAEAGIQHFLKKFSISSTGYHDLDTITESILVYALLLHYQYNRPYDIRDNLDISE